MRKKKGIAPKALIKAADVFDLPGEAVAGVPRVTVTGTSRVHVENHRGLLEYGTEEICVNAGRQIIRIRGKHLELSAMSDIEMVTTGVISSVEFLT